MLSALAAEASHPAVAGLLGIGAAGLAGAVVGMAWSVHARQIRLAEQMARRQLVVTADGGRAADRNGGHETAAPGANGTAGAAPPGRVLIDGPDTVVTGEQARFRVQPSPVSRKVTSWAVGGGSLTQSPDPAHPDELLLIADQPGDLTVTVWVREGMNERRATKPVTAVPDVTPAPPITLRLFLHGWSLVVVAVLIIGFAGALVALGDLTSGDFIALAAPLAALLGVVAVARGTADAASGPPVRPAKTESLNAPSPAQPSRAGRAG
ncbi:MAG TPA: hypothetical protein VMI33_27045 [Streptosporangiaceae bacterium]|nr:hypothetical protein [Streptosporangiaceae bacterium]